MSTLSVHVHTSSSVHKMMSNCKLVSTKVHNILYTIVFCAQSAQNTKDVHRVHNVHEFQLLSAHLQYIFFMIS